MGALVDGFGGKISGELIRASDWNGMLAAVEALVAGVQTAIEARLEPLEDAVDALGPRVTALEGAVADLTNVAATLRARYRRMNLTAGASRFVAQSYAGWPYARVGGSVKSETDLLDPAPRPPFRRTLEAIRHLEDAVTKGGGIEGLALRYGAFYGPGTSIALEPPGETVMALRKRGFPVIGGGAGVWSEGCAGSSGFGSAGASPSRVASPS